MYYYLYLNTQKIYGIFTEYSQHPQEYYYYNILDIIYMSFDEIIPFVSYALIIAGTFVLLFTINSFTSNSILGKIIGYVSFFFAIIILLLPTFKRLANESANLGPSIMIFKLLDEMSPFLFFLASLVLSGIILSLYHHDFKTKVPSDSFKKFTAISSLLIIIQSIMFVYSYTQIKKSMIDTAKLRLLGIINLIVVFSSYFAIKNFTTDGFTV
jgi:hypothetical protein